MSSAVIIGGGDFPRKEYPRELIRRADYIVCCDGHALSAFMRNRSRIFDSPAQAALPSEGHTLPTFMRNRSRIIGSPAQAALPQEGSGPAAKTLPAGGRLPDAVVGDLPNAETLPAGGRLPDAVVGDMDSVSARQLSEFSSLLVKVEEQDDNDQTKAFNHILRSYPDVDTIHIVAATGKRECHTIGNMGLLMEYARKHGACGIPSEGCIYVDMVSDYSTIFAITDSCGFFVGEGRQVSLFSPDNSLTIKSEGLAWQTSGVVFDNWWPASLNRATADFVKLTFSHPSAALVILD